jgi:hypothetical protein
MLALLFVLFGFLPVEERGLTGTVQNAEVEVVGDVTDEVILGAPVLHETRRLSSHTKDSADWLLIDSCFFHGRIPAGKKYEIEVDGGLLPTPPDTLTSLAVAAVDAVPEWLRLPLWENFSRMTTQCQNVYGELIISTPYPWQDEVAFQIARIDPGILLSQVLSPTLCLENAQLVYKSDSVLDYVELVEYPDYTTAKYNIISGNDTSVIEISRDHYYWDVVHPIISDEKCAYINAHTGGEFSPPVGVFWRDFLFNWADTADLMGPIWSLWGPPDTIHPGDVSPILREALAGVEYLWIGEYDSLAENSAVSAVTKWVQDVMVFNSGAERPIQPVRIYHMHKGRCGEHSDITVAAGRAALIPTNGTLTMCNDHTWNEFWDTEWRIWETSYVTFINSNHFDPGWFDIRLTINHRGDGLIWDVTPRYTPYCTLTVTVNDVSGSPVDGARVSVASTAQPHKAVYTAGWRFTKSDGKASFFLGDNAAYYARIDAGGLGAYPPGTNVTEVITSSLAGGHYTWSRDLSGTMPSLDISPDSMIDTLQLYKVEVNFESSQEIIRGKSRWQMSQRFARFVDEGNIEFFICDSANYAEYEADSAFKAFEIGEDVASGNVSFVFPEDKWWIVFSNEDAANNGEVLDFQVKLYKNQAAVAETHRQRTQLAVSPSPFSSFASIDLQVPHGTKVDLAVYDLTGRCVKQIIKGKTLSGHHNISLDGQELGNNVYFIRLATGDKTEVRKIIKL